MVRRGGSRGRASGRGGDGTRAGRTVRATRRRSRSESPGVCPGASAWWTLLVFALSSLSSRRPLFFFFLPGAAGDPSGPGLAFRFPGPSPPRVGLDRKKMTPPSFARVDLDAKNDLSDAPSRPGGRSNTPNGGSSIEHWPRPLPGSERRRRSPHPRPLRGVTSDCPRGPEASCCGHNARRRSSSLPPPPCVLGGVGFRRFKGVSKRRVSTPHAQLDNNLDNFWNLEVTGQNRSPDTRKPRGLPRALPHFSKSTQPPTV